MGQTSLFFVYFRFFFMTQINYKLIKVLLVCLGFESGVAGWKAYTNALSYLWRHPKAQLLLQPSRNYNLCTQNVSAK